MQKAPAFPIPLSPGREQPAAREGPPYFHGLNSRGGLGRRFAPIAPAFPIPENRRQARGASCGSTAPAFPGCG
jgi:hypothetical protein